MTVAVVVRVVTGDGEEDVKRQSVAEADATVARMTPVTLISADELSHASASAKARPASPWHSSGR